MSQPVHFTYNGISWQGGSGIPDGMAAALVDPIREHLPQATIGEEPVEGAINVYMTHQRGHWRPEGQSVFFSHGIADKNWRDARRLADYDYVIVSGSAWVRKMAEQGFDTDRLIEGGYPKLDPIFQGRVKRRRPEANICWAPTHNGKPSVSTWPWCEAAAPKLEDRTGMRVVIAPHPRHRRDRRTTMQELVDADVVVADGGSTIYEAMALGKPVVLCDWKVREGVIDRSDPRTPSFEVRAYVNRISYHATGEHHLAELCVEAAEAGPTPEATAFVEDIFPTRLRGTSGRVIADSLSDIAEGQPPRAIAPPIDVDPVQTHPEGEIAIFNRSRTAVVRGGHVFPPHELVQLVLPSGVARTEITSCRYLTVWEG